MSEYLDMALFTTTTVPITVDNLPSGEMCEADGSRWRAIVDQDEPNGWRWQPLNWDAFAKAEPNSEMTEFCVLNLSPVMRPSKMP